MQKYIVPAKAEHQTSHEKTLKRGVTVEIGSLPGLNLLTAEFNSTMSTKTSRNLQL